MLDPQTGNEYKYKNRKNPEDDRTTVRPDGHIILPLMGFDPLDCGHMRCIHNRQKAMRTTRQREKRTEIQA